MNESKSSLKDDSPVQERKGFHVLIAKWEESPERNKFHELWEKHGLSIILVCLTVCLLAYSIAAIAISGFDKAKWLFAITMFLWFCMTYMFIRDHCGSEIYRVVLKPIVDAVNSKWKYLRWYVECSFLLYTCLFTLYYQCHILYFLVCTCAFCFVGLADLLLSFS